MFFAVVIALAVIVLLGVTAKLFVPRLFPAFAENYNWRISGRELIVGNLVAAVVMVIVFLVGNHLAVADQLRYQEFYNGVEVEAGTSATKCHAGTRGNNASSGRSNCEHAYDTGETYWYEESYWVSEPYGCPTADNPGKMCSKSVEKKRSVPASIYAPYAKTEYKYFITDSIGGEYKFPKTYVNAGDTYGNRAIPADVPKGQPADWVDAKQRIDEENPRPVTRLFDYDNYILASQDDMLVPYSEDVERYLADELLPEHTFGINDQPLGGINKSHASKVSFVGYEPADPQDWQDAAMQFNAALGSQLRGDLHIVVIDSKLVDSPTNYLNALKAYWLDTEYFGKRAIAKNAIIVVVGANGTQVEWGIASTGMPFGNETMLQGVQNFLPGTDLTPEAIIGAPRTVVTPASSEDEDDTVQVTLSDSPGVLEQIILRDFPFERACMDCGDDEGQIGYDNLVAKIQPTFGQIVVMQIIIAFLSVGYWVWAGFSSLLDPQHYRKSNRTTYRRY